MKKEYIQVITTTENKEEAKTIINVKGRYFMNSPMISFHISNGKKAANVVAVDEMIGQATSPTPSFAASSGLKPSCISR